MLREFLSLRNSSDSYIYGHSYGGWLAAYYATKSNTCRGIILEGAGGLKEISDERTSKEKFRSMNEEAFKGVMKASVSNEEYVIRSVMQSQYGKDLLTTEALSRIKVPVLIIWGSEDKAIDVKFSYIFNKKIKNSRLEIVEGAGHGVHDTNPEIVAGLLLKFINSTTVR